MAKMTTVRALISVAASQSWHLFQMDVKNAFLHGDFKEDIYMRVPPCVERNSISDICRLRRSLYGLKQEPRAWFEKLHKRLFINLIYIRVQMILLCLFVVMVLV